VSAREERFRQLVYSDSAFVLGYLRNRVPASGISGPEDLLSEVMAIAWNKLDSIPDGGERAWLIAVARNRLLNERSKSNRRSRLAFRLRPIPSGPSAEEEWLADSELQSALQMLSTLDREVLLLSYWEGLPLKDVATIVGTTERSVASRLTRAKRNLRCNLSETTADQYEKPKG
jgi:RNA polymerase sigma-70 factor (ECF subfamily)